MKPQVFIWAEANDELIARIIRVYDQISQSVRCVNASTYAPSVVSAASALVVILDQQWCDTYLRAERNHGEALDNSMAQATSLALRRGIPVFPVLLNGATFPQFSEIHPELSGLTLSQAYSLTLDDSKRTDARLGWLLFLLEIQLGVRKVTFTPIWIGLAFACLEVALVVIGVVMHIMILAIIGAVLLAPFLYFAFHFSFLGTVRKGLCMILLFGGETLVAIVVLSAVQESFSSIVVTALGTLMIVGFFFFFPISGFYGRAQYGGGEILLRRTSGWPSGRPGTAVREFFLSYRHEDSAEFTMRIYNFLFRKGRGAFLDKSAIVPGANFISELHQKIDECLIMFVIIGPKWISAQFPNGVRRLDDPGDYVRMEIGAALKQYKVVPIVVDETAMPTRDELPSDLAGLARQPPYRVHSDKRFSTDMSSVLRGVQSYLYPQRYQYWDLALGISVSAAFFLVPVVITLLMTLSSNSSNSEGALAASLVAPCPAVASAVFLVTCLLAAIHGVRSRRTTFVVVLVVWTALTCVLEVLGVAVASSPPWQLSVISTTLWLALYVGLSYMIVMYAAGFEVIVRRSRAQAIRQK